MHLKFVHTLFFVFRLAQTRIDHFQCFNGHLASDNLLVLAPMHEHV